MPRRTRQNYRCQPLADLARQMLFAPVATRRRQLGRAEQLHDELDPDQTYPVEHITRRITGYRPEAADDRLLVGDAVQADLRLLIDTISRSIAVPLDEAAEAEGETGCQTPEQLAGRLNVSTKTLSRWRGLGLRWRWVKMPGEAQPRLVYPQQAVERFLQRHGDLAERAARFSHLPEPMRQAILTRARRIAQARPVTLNQVARHLARRLGRAVETVRQVLAHHDRQHPDQAIFTDCEGPLDARRKRLIARAWRLGVPVAKLVRRFNRTRATIYRVVAEQRAAGLRRLEIRWVDSPLFHRDDADDLLLAPETETPPEDEPVDVPGQAAADAGDVQGQVNEETVAPADPVTAGSPTDAATFPTAPAPGWPDALQPLLRWPAIPPRRQGNLALRMNYLLFKAAKLRDALDRHHPSQSTMDRIDRLLADAAALRTRLVRTNLPLLARIVQQHAAAEMPQPSPTPSAHVVLEMLEEGFPVLLTGVCQYDVSRSPTLPQRLAWLLRRAFATRHPPSTALQARAHRRLRPEQVLQRLGQKAAGAGVRL